MAAVIPDPQGYFRGLVPLQDELLAVLESEAHREKIPIVGPVAGELLFILSRATAARTVLEPGTASGYSTLYPARAVAAVVGQVITLESARPLRSWPSCPGRLT